MKIEIRVKTNARHEKVEDLGQSIFRVVVKAPPQEGKANEAVIALLAEYFSVPKSRVTILSGHKSKRKRLEVKK